MIFKSLDITVLFAWIFVIHVPVLLVPVACVAAAKHSTVAQNVSSPRSLKADLIGLWLDGVQATLSTAAFFVDALSYSIEGEALA